MPSVVSQAQVPASPQMPAPLQTPAAAAPFQEDWNAEISQEKEAPREQEGGKKRRRLWPRLCQSTSTRTLSNRFFIRQVTQNAK